VWQWLLDPSGGYSVYVVYAMLTTQETLQNRHDVDLVWHKQVLLKVSIFTWRLLWDCLPTKTNLATRGVLDSEVCLCVFGCGHLEDTRHLFLSCRLFGSIWPLLRSWFGFDGVDHYDISDHFAQFTYYTGGLKSRRSFLQLVWLLTVWFLWNKRNNILFK